MTLELDCKPYIVNFCIWSCESHTSFFFKIFWVNFECFYVILSSGNFGVLWKFLRKVSVKLFEFTRLMCKKWTSMWFLIIPNKKMDYISVYLTAHFYYIYSLSTLFGGVDYYKNISLLVQKIIALAFQNIEYISRILNENYY